MLPRNALRIRRPQHLPRYTLSHRNRQSATSPTPPRPTPAAAHLPHAARISERERGAEHLKVSCSIPHYRSSKNNRRAPFRLNLRTCEIWFRRCSNYFLVKNKSARCEDDHSSLCSTRGPTAAPPHVHAPPPAASCLKPPACCFLTRVPPTAPPPYRSSLRCTTPQTAPCAS